MNCANKENHMNIDVESNEISHIYNDLKRLTCALGQMGLFHTQLMLEQVTNDYEHAIFRQICRDNELNG